MWFSIVVLWLEAAGLLDSLAQPNININPTLKHSQPFKSSSKQSHGHPWYSSKFRHHSFWGKKITPKKCICDICYFATKKPRWFELGLNQWKALVFHTLLFISTICTHILSWVFTIVPKFTLIVHIIKQKVRKLFRKSIHFRVVFWKNYDTRKFFFTTVSRDGRDKSHVHVCD